MGTVLHVPAQVFRDRPALDKFIEELREAGKALPVEALAGPSIPAWVPGEYVRYRDVDAILMSRYRVGVTRRWHVSHLWGVIVREAVSFDARKTLFSGRCLRCNKALSHHDNQRCRALLTSRFRDVVEIESKSLIAHQVDFNEVDIRQVGFVTKADFDYLVDALTHQ